MGIPVLEKDDHLFVTKLAFKDTDRVTDEQAEKIFMDTELKSKEDVDVLLNYMAQHRPELAKKLNAIAKQKQEVAAKH